MEHVILFAGPMGAGKTTAIQSLSEIEVVRTEAENTERDVVDKPTTTVALDYGEITLSEDEKVRLYGIPGQRRFDFMWQILKERAEGMVLLVNNDANRPLEMVIEFLAEFSALCADGGVVVGITRADVSEQPTERDYADAIAQVYPGAPVPVLTVDPREAGDMRIALLTLVANLDARTAFVSSTTDVA